MKKIVTRTLVSCAALAVVGGALIAPTLATERSQTASAAPAVTTLSATAVSDAAKPAALDEAGAKTLALETAGLTADQVSRIWAKRDYDDGRLEYEVEFLSGDWKYEVEVDAASGTVRSYDQDRKGRGYTQSGTDIGAEAAQTAALTHAGVKAADTLFMETEVDVDDGLRVYEVDFFAGSREYDYKIDAATGAVLSFDYDIEWYAPAAGGEDLLTETQVKQIVERTAGTTGVYTKFQLEHDDGRLLYEGELRSGRMEYEFEIDAATGAILDWDADRD